MPIYEFQCTNETYCDSNLRYEKEFSINESHEVNCGICHSPMVKIYSSIAVVFKGSGFYSTDSR